MRKSHILALACTLWLVSNPVSLAASQQAYTTYGALPPETKVENWVVPAAKAWQAKAGQFTLKRGARIVLPVAGGADLQALARDFAADVAEVSELTLPVVVGSPRPGDIVLSLEASDLTSPSNEAYHIAIDHKVTLTGRARSGVLYAAQSLLQLLKHGAKGRSLPMGVILDAPDYARRAVMVDVGRRYYEISVLEDLMRQMAWLKLNTLSLHFTDWPAFRLNSAKFPGLADRQSYDREDIRRLEATARRYGITIIPEIDLPAHAAAIIRYKPSLAFACPSMRQSPWLTKAAGDDAKNMAWTIDITRDENRRWLQSLLAEFVPWFDGPYFHIGGDEYQYDADKTRCPELMAYTEKRGFAHPGDVFVDWINETDQFVRTLGKQTAIWSWWRFGDDKTSIQPNTAILIYSWNPPRLASIVADGYRVIATPEDTLYISPGLEKDGNGYGIFDADKVYANFPLERAPSVDGYMVSLWADGAEHHTDSFFMGRLYEPMGVLSERLWSGGGSASTKAFLARLNKASVSPRRPAQDLPPEER